MLELKIVTSFQIKRNLKIIWALILQWCIKDVQKYKQK